MPSRGTLASKRQFCRQTSCLMQGCLFWSVSMVGSHPTDHKQNESWRASLLVCGRAIAMSDARAGPVCDASSSEEQALHPYIDMTLTAYTSGIDFGRPKVVLCSNIGQRWAICVCTHCRSRKQTACGKEGQSQWAEFRVTAHNVGPLSTQTGTCFSYVMDGDFWARRR